MLGVPLFDNHHHLVAAICDQVDKSNRYRYLIIESSGHLVSQPSPLRSSPAIRSIPCVSDSSKFPIN